MEIESKNPAPAPIPEADAADLNVADIVATAGQRLPIAALNDWLTFLQGPSNALFFEDSSFDSEWKRLFRLVGLVLLMLGAIIAIFSIGLNATGQSWRDFASSSKYLLLVLVAGAVVAVPYAFVLAPVLRIRITLVQTFFAVLLLGLPWLPLITLVWAFGKVWNGGLLVVILLYIMTLVPLYNFCKGVSVLGRCRIWRPILSLSVPLGFALAIFVANVVWDWNS